MIKILDHDLDPHDLIDRVIVNQQLSPSPSFSSVMSISGIYNKAMLQLSGRVQCFEDYYGSACTTYCTTQSSATLGYFTCNSNGSRVCSPGYTGTSCMTRERLCVIVFIDSYFVAILIYSATTRLC